MLAVGLLKSTIANLQSAIDYSILEQIIERLARTIGLRCWARRCLLLHADAHGVESAFVARVFFSNSCWNGLHTLEAARWIKISTLFAGVQLKIALLALAERLRQHRQQRPALRAARNRMRTWHLHRSRTERVVFILILATWRLLLGRLLARLATVLIPVLAVFTIRQ